MKEKIKLELLAPAKDKECAMTAILSGADAVYIGASAFGARQKAGNSIEDLKEIINFAHLFDVKIYVTVNTILFDNELDEVKKLIEKLYEIKADAIIFQDFSLLSKDNIPIELHSSTQCNNFDLDKIKFFEKCNVKRVVLPREFSLSQISEVKKSTNMEIEAFCHGALCVSLSGQCYLSDYIGKRSANRGECAQPCRKKYSLIDEKGKIFAKDKYLLCLKDLNLEKSIAEMINVGVTSFKIEGRLKDKLYVKNAVLKYSEILNKFIEKNPQFERQAKGILNKDFRADLSKTFNRGFCEYFINGAPKNITSFETPKFKGEFLGTVKEIFKDGIIIDTKKEINPQDGITFFVENELVGTKVIGVNGLKIKLLSSKGIKKGAKIYRNYDFEYMNSLEKYEISRKLPVDIKIKFCENVEIIAYAKNSSVVKIFEGDFEEANNKNLAKENLKKQFSKTGNTNFVLNDLKIEGDKIFHLKLSDINSMRNVVLKSLQEQILSDYKTRKRDLNFEYPKYFCENANYLHNVSNIEAENFLKKCGVKNAEYAPEVTRKYQRLMVTKHCLKREMGLCSKNCGKLFLKDEFGKKYPLKFDCKNCSMEVWAK